MVCGWATLGRGRSGFSPAAAERHSGYPCVRRNFREKKLADQKNPEIKNTRPKKKAPWTKCQYQYQHLWVFLFPDFYGESGIF